MGCPQMYPYPVAIDSSYLCQELDILPQLIRNLLGQSSEVRTRMDQDGPGWSRMDNRIVQNVRKNGACLTGGFTDWNVFRFLELRMFSHNLLVAALLGFAICLPQDVIKHRKNCKRCPVSLLIVRSQRLP